MRTRELRTQLFEDGHLFSLAILPIFCRCLSVHTCWSFLLFLQLVLGSLLTCFFPAEPCGPLRLGSFCAAPLTTAFSTPQSNAQSTSLEAAATDFYYDMLNVTSASLAGNTSSSFITTNNALLQSWACSGTYWQCGSCGRTDCFIYTKCVDDCNAASRAVNATGDSTFMNAYYGSLFVPWFPVMPL
jgi:hypothetical protein